MTGGFDVNYEVLPDGAKPTPGFAGISLHAGDIAAIGAPRLGIGGLPTTIYQDSTGDRRNANVANFVTGAASIVLREGAVLKAGEVFLVSGRLDGGIVVEQGAGINTLGRGKAAWDSRDGFTFNPGIKGILAVSNGWLDLLAPTFSTSPTDGSGRIDIGACAPGAVCNGTTQIYSEGTIAAATDKTFMLRDSARYGTRNLVLAVGGINVGSEASLEAAGARGALPSGLALNQGVLDRLMRGDTSTGAPALENLVLTARDSVNFYDSVELSTIDAATGKSSLERLVIGSPAIYGAGGADALARIRTDVLVWNGAAAAPGTVAAGGAGTGSGRLEIDAREIELGSGAGTRPDTIHSMDRLILGFGDVSLKAGERITSSNTGSLSVYQSQGAWDDTQKGFVRTGGNLGIQTPLITGQAGSVQKFKAGGDIVASAPAGGIAGALTGAALADALGAEIGFDGASVTLDTRVALPSGKLTLAAERDVRLGDAAVLDLAGRRIDFHDISKYSWGGDVAIESRGGNVVQSAGSRIDISAAQNRAGKLSVLAVGEGAGLVDLRGVILGASSGSYDAGGTDVPYAAGGADIRAQRIGDFTGLNQRLNEGGVLGSRGFQLKQGDLVLGDEVRSREISVSVDAGRLLVNGTVDASGEQAGSIRLAARDGVTIASSAVLDAHSRVLRVDSYGQPIEAPNRATIDIDAGSGRLVLESGARMDVRAGTNGTPQSFGTVELSAQRIGGARGNDIAIDAGGALRIDGARGITVNGFWSYSDAAYGADPAADGRPYQVVDQAYLDAKHADSTVFMGQALANADLMNNRLAGLRAYGDAFHLRPGVAVVSATPDGDLHVDGDIDLSGYRYASVNPHTQRSGVYGSGEAGALVLRAGGNLKVYGSITDGFDGSVVIPATTNDQGWVLVKGRVPWGGEVVVPHGDLVTLAEDTFFLSGRTLNYDLPMKAMSLRAGTLLAAGATLTADLVLPEGSVLGAAVRDAAGNVVYTAGTVLSKSVTLRSGMKLDAGNRLPGAAQVAAMTWPAGVPLPFPNGAPNDTASPDYNGDGKPDIPLNGVVLAGPLKLAKGAVVPSETFVRLPDGVDFVALRPADADGAQGRSWAVAPMLAAGSQSWSMRLVAGADTGAADTRALRPRDANGRLVLADTHYGMAAAIALREPVDGVPGQYYWMGDSLTQIGYAPGTLVDLDEWGGEEAVRDLNNMGLGNLVTWAPLGESPSLEPKPATQQLFSVLRTGTGDLDLLSGGDFSTHSPYGIYTAGTQSAAVAPAYNQPRARVGGLVLGSDGGDYEAIVDGGSRSLYSAWYPEHGGNVLVRAQGDVTGDLVGGQARAPRADELGTLRTQVGSADVGNWLWRQGTGSAAPGAEGVPTAWWINFGSYVTGSYVPEYAEIYKTAPTLVGFTGIGTLGGGNLVFEAGGNAGLLQPHTDIPGIVSRGSGLNLVVGSTGRVSANRSALTLAGGGDLDVRIGGSLNPVAEVNLVPGTADVTPQTRYGNSRTDLNSTFVNLRGAMRLETGSTGTIELRFDRSDAAESRAYSPYTATTSIAGGGPVLVPGDSGIRIDARGDLVLGGVGDPGRVAQFHNGTPFVAQGTAYEGQGFSWFSLWTPSTGIDLFSAGGNVAPLTSDNRQRSNDQATDGRFVMPSIFRAVAASGNLFYGNSVTGALGSNGKPQSSTLGMIIAPPPTGGQFSHAGAGALELVAGDSIYAGGYAVSRSGADGTALPTPFNPGFSGTVGTAWFGDVKLSNVDAGALAPSVLLAETFPGISVQRYPLFSLTPPTASGNAVPGQQPARFYASQGDIVGLRTGSIIERSNLLFPLDETWYEGSGPVAIRAGRDIVNSGTLLGTSEGVPDEAKDWTTQASRADANAPLKPIVKAGTNTAHGNLILHNNPDDISVVSAGRDIRYSSFYVAGPGLLEITAGRDLYMADKAEIRSMGPVLGAAAGDRNGGAGIAVAVGVGPHGPDFSAFAARYLDPDNLADPGRSLASQPGKAVTVYSDRLTLAAWLGQEFGYGGDEAGAASYLAARQSELDASRQQAAAGSSGAVRRDLQREYDVTSQLHLVNWLDQRFGGHDGRRNGLGLHFDAATMDARAFFAALPAEQQRAFLRPVYYAELKAAGREYGAAGGPREGSYLRGREAIATLFPRQDYQGDLTMFSSALYFDDLKGTGITTPTTRPHAGVQYMTEAQWIAAGSNYYKTAHYEVQDAGIHTDFGGDVRIMVPGGRTLVGVDGGFVPSEGSGVLTQGAGDIEIFSTGSILLGQSRIFTTFGGNILAWSSQGDINAGRGSKSTVVFTPQKRVYDDVGLVTLSPNTPNTGAGIATLNPVPEVPPGDVDLIAPLGTIDAGEAGIRVSGNVNLAALRVVNAENIQVKGQAVGIPAVAAVNVGALANASAAASQAAAAAQDVMQRERASQRQALPSVFTVRVLGFGDDPAGSGGEGAAPKGRDQRAGYDPQGVVQVLGAGTLTASQMQSLTPGERSGLRQ